jgi:hypothetical protein
MNFWALQTTDDFYTGIGGRLHYQQAPQNELFPYATWSIISHNPEYWMGGLQFEYLMIQINIFSQSTSAEEVEGLEKYCQTLFDDELSMTVTGYTVKKFERTADRSLGQISPQLPKGIDEQMAQTRIVEYEIMLQKN